MSYRYFYIHIMTPGGLAANYVRTTHHPLHPEEEAKIQQNMIHLMAQATGQLGFKPEQFPIMQVTELEEEVARERWSKDFEDTEKPAATGLILPP